MSANWGPVASAIVAVLVSVWTTASHFVQITEVQIAAAVFLFSLWTLIGVSILSSRRKPILIKSYEDYQYALTFEGLVPHYDPNSEKATLGFGLTLRNFSPHPIKYTIEQFDVEFNKRSLPVVKGALGAYVPRGGVRVSRNVPFEKDDIKDYVGKEVKAQSRLLYYMGIQP
ncbi:MAG: hypothetical protein MZV49_25480, partial [Rhodopseudomonas palustris]|nr:hypothetical protein [Rhodopseudomonas palustris]